MALTPEDVLNKRFQATKFREGYDVDEVDDFLDEVVVELKRLLAENADLRRRLGEESADASQTTAIPAPVAASPNAVKATDEKAAAPQADDENGPAAIPPVAVTPAPAVTSAESAAGVLAMAQRLHDEYVNAGVEQRDKIIAEAQLEATGLVDDAEEKSRKTLGDLEEQKTVLEQTVEQLRGFERDYRARLKAYIEGQLRELDTRDSLATEATS
ncbi:DivIVA domain-containing protein [Arthrobacter pityocampae]|uniref:Cell wall synthesis protein Wag31 n=1 Tax=Arthrobacter pityocampae TaxID=547334 RepID=A0A2S5J060_9MICC|nr:DivIVA domain-containing protein [Arthrobacter pityocampae]PPB50232.1 cell division protein [Arthrobacter pityocampae]